MKKIASALSCLLLLCLLSGCALCESTYKLPIDFSGGMPLNAEWETGVNVYEDPTIRVERERVVSPEWQCTYYVVRITIADPSQLRTAFAKGFDSNGRVYGTTMAKRVNAVLAINGDYYSGRSGSFVLRQGQLFRETMDPGQDLLLIDENADFHILMAEEHPENLDKTTVDGKKVINALCFGPALVKDGEKVLDISHEQRNTHGQKRAQRLCLCQLGPLEYMVVGCSHYGMNLSDFTDLVMSLADVKQAYNLDGGNSAHIIFLGHKINNTEYGSARLLPDIVYFASAWPGEEAEQ